MKPVGLLVHKRVVLGHKLPADFRRDDVGVDRGRGGIVRIGIHGGTGRRRCHDANENNVGQLLVAELDG